MLNAALAIRFRTRNQATFGGGQQKGLTIAQAQEDPRLTEEGARHTDFELTQPHHFLTCCEQMAVKKKGQAAARGMLVPIRFGMLLQGGHAKRTTFVPSPLVEVVLDLAQHAQRQPTRMYSPGLAITQTAAYLVVLDHETCRIATISDCWGEGSGELGVVLSILFGLDVYSAGFNPLFRYACHSNSGIKPVSFLASCLRPPELEEGAPLVGRIVEFIDEEPIELVHSTLRDDGSIFSRSTVVLQLTRPSLVAPAGSASSPSNSTPSFVLKVQYNTLNYVGHEATVLQKIEERCASIASPEESSLIFNHISLLEKPKSFGLHYSQIKDEDLPVRRDGQDAHQRVLRRKLDLLILRNPTPLPTRVHGHRHSRHPMSDAFYVLDRLFTLLPVLYDLGIHHRDLSLGNILHHRGHLVLVDWDSGIVAPPGELVRCAAEDCGSARFTLDTASSGALFWLLTKRDKAVAERDLADDFESVVYWFFYIVGSFLEFLSPPTWAAWYSMYLTWNHGLPDLAPLYAARLDLWGDIVSDRQERVDLLNAMYRLSPVEGRLLAMLTRKIPDFPMGSVQTTGEMAKMQVKMRKILGPAFQPRP